MFVIIMLFQSIGSNTLYLDANADADVNTVQEPCKILFIGSSYIIYNLFLQNLLKILPSGIL